MVQATVGIRKALEECRSGDFSHWEVIQESAVAKGLRTLQVKHGLHIGEYDRLEKNQLKWRMRKYAEELNDNQLVDRIIRMAAEQGQASTCIDILAQGRAEELSVYKEVLLDRLGKKS